ncbi:hypothetical protein MCOR17_006896 [Pyricularia oryzae]|nr:hypothetical protein MCOR17_006896 [Pyricularia oryzae]
MLLSLLPASLLLAIASAKQYNVTVGKGGLKFDPEIITGAQKGDTIRYSFFAANHSVVESNFADPCVPLNGGAFSGFVPTASPDKASATTFTIELNDTKPRWIYCSQGAHCKSGMVHSINAPTSGNTHDAYKQKASQATPSSPQSKRPVGGVREVTVEVAPAGELRFQPNNITEPAGTVVKFNFNPANHTVTSSSFDKPCEPNQDGFSSGFIPTQQSPSGVSFHIEVKDEKPVWFYCAAGPATGGHCSKGMVGAINAPASGNTLEAFVEKAKTVLAASIPPKAPIGGVVTANGTQIATFNGNVLNVQVLDKGVISHVPKPGDNTTEAISGMAGGSQPLNYGWGETLSPAALEHLEVLLLIDNAILDGLWDGFDRLKAGNAWAGVWPPAIVSVIGGAAAQALVHRTTLTDALQHFNQGVKPACRVSFPTGSIDEWLAAVQSLLTLQIGVLTDAITQLASSDPWLVPALGTQIGAKSRSSAVVNMIQRHKASPAAREPLLPAKLALSFVHREFVQSCPEEIKGGLAAAKQLPELTFSDRKKLGATDSVTAVNVVIPAEAPGDGELYVAWIGAWGSLQFTVVRRSDGFATVPANMYGTLWAVLTTKQNVKLQEVADVAVAGPEPIWVADPSS